MSRQYLRKIGLFVTDEAGDGIDLSKMQIIFEVNQADSETPNTAKIRIFNLSEETRKRVEKEFKKIRLQAGYENGNYGVIFEGQVMRWRHGRLDAKDSFLDLFCADGDKAFQFAFVNKSLAAGATLEDKMQAVSEATQPYGVTFDSGGQPIPSTGGVLPRGKVLFGLAKDQMGPIADTSDTTWSIQDGKLTLIPFKGYLPGEIVVINSGTGMIGVPEATENGVEAEVLLNPKIKIGTRVQIDNNLINQTNVNQQGFPRYTDINFFASVSDDGVYRALVVEHRGDTRGTLWTTSITCLSINQSASQSEAVLPYGLPEDI